MGQNQQTQKLFTVDTTNHRNKVRTTEVAMNANERLVVVAVKTCCSTLLLAVLLPSRLLWIFALGCSCTSHHINPTPAPLWWWCMFYAGGNGCEAEEKENPCHYIKNCTSHNPHFKKKQHKISLFSFRINTGLLFKWLQLNNKQTQILTCSVLSGNSSHIMQFWSLWIKDHNRVFLFFLFKSWLWSSVR